MDRVVPQCIRSTPRRPPAISRSCFVHTTGCGGQMERLAATSPSGSAQEALLPVMWDGRQRGQRRQTGADPSWSHLSAHSEGDSDDGLHTHGRFDPHDGSEEAARRSRRGLGRADRRGRLARRMPGGPARCRSPRLGRRRPDARLHRLPLAPRAERHGDDAARVLHRAVGRADLGRSPGDLPARHRRDPRGHGTVVLRLRRAPAEPRGADRGIARRDLR